MMPIAFYLKKKKTQKKTKEKKRMYSILFISMPYFIYTKKEIEQIFLNKTWGPQIVPKTQCFFYLNEENPWWQSFTG